MPGLLRRHAVVPSSWVSRAPSHLSFVEASTIGGAGLSAWNILFGSANGPRSPHDMASATAPYWVLTQGTGAVSMFAAAFAVLLGASVVSTTSSDAKAHWLRDLGVTQVLNYNADPAWGDTARRLSPDGEGVDLVVDVGGAGTLAQSLKAIRYDGTVAVTGFLTEGVGPAIMDVLPRAANVRGILGGSREQFEDMARMIEEWKFRPVVDARVFGFDEAKEAYEYVWAQKHVGKVVIDMTK
jgi:NADPH:quinone reductase-like Zn-dependent oxidoreductase